jgi:hypothetical protein
MTDTLTWPTYPNDVAARHLLFAVAERSTLRGWLDPYILTSGDKRWIDWHNLKAGTARLNLSRGEWLMVCLACDIAIGPLASLDQVDASYNAVAAEALRMVIGTEVAA